MIQQDEQDFLCKAGGGTPVAALAVIVEGRL
jgi:hypothetical protein